MSPRRPAPARPGNRPGAGRRASGAKATPTVKPARRETASRLNSTAPKQETTPPAIKTTKDPGRSSRWQIGGDKGFSISYGLLAIVAVLTFAIVFAGPAARQFLVHRAELADAKRQLAQAQATQAALQQELARWDDDAYARSQARERLGYVMPGETSYVVVGAEELETKQKPGAATVPSQMASPWYQTLTESVRLAARPQPTASPRTTPSSGPSGTPTTPTAPSTTATEAPTPAPNPQETP
ncbi:Septum formation initiator [Actinomyces bovis]|uniref:Septum formation initiator n=1 Tax=Actinomyces bovis TaxID=1658 RepID=A0ABY1VM18_9ACTO|nr:septum formation initiator family protein [Actinomyces bovis]SPT53141.1 Septum formation initiator [Actinomyces bovis]VEG52305.1 Septum formation initiator [Actinomyces israelii]